MGYLQFSVGLCILIHGNPKPLALKASHFDRLLPHIMSGGLFEDAAPTPPAAAAQESSEARRTKLYPWDSVAAQMFEPHGVSALDTMTLKELWEGTARGNKKVSYHSHLCADASKDAWHVGAGVSLTAATLIHAIEFFKSSDMSRLIKEDLFAKVSKEIDSLEPSLRVLNLGKGSRTEQDTGSFRAAKRLRASTGTAKPQVTEDELKSAARILHAWLQQPQSALRSVLFALSGSGTYYAAHAAELVARAAIAHKPMKEEDFVHAMITRARIPAETMESKGSTSDATGLFGP